MGTNFLQQINDFISIIKHITNPINKYWFVIIPLSNIILICLNRMWPFEANTFLLSNWSILILTTNFHPNIIWRIYDLPLTTIFRSYKEEKWSFFLYSKISYKISLWLPPPLQVSQLFCNGVFSELSHFTIHKLHLIPTIIENFIIIWSSNGISVSITLAPNKSISSFRVPSWEHHLRIYINITNLRHRFQLFTKGIKYIVVFTFIFIKIKGWSLLRTQSHKIINW